MKQNLPVKVIIADTAFIIRKGLRTLIQENQKFKYVAEVTDAKALTLILRKKATDVLIVDHCCDDCFSLEAIKKIKTENPALKILVISHEKTADEIKKIIGIGIKNYLLKDCDEEEITQAIEACAKGEKFFCGQIVDVLLEKEISQKEHCEPSTLSQRESEIVKLVAEGFTGKEIAKKLFLSHYTVSTHRKNISKKLHINSTSELILYAIQIGLVSPQKQFPNTLH